MCKTFAAIQRHVDADAATLPLRPEVSGCWDELPEVTPADDDVTALDEAVRTVDPDVVVENSRYRHDERDYPREYPLVHVRHGSSVGRDEMGKTTSDLAGIVDVALAPGEYWATHYREQFPDDVRTPVVGIPEADDLVGADPPDERRVLYAPTNHNYGGGSYLRAAEHVLDVFADSEYELLFRPHPHDRREEPGRSLTQRCRDRIADLPNVVFDDDSSPKASVLNADLLVSDYSGIVTEWLHTGRPLVQLTDLAADTEVPQLGYTTDRLSIELVDELYEDGYPSDVERRIEVTRSELGIPMDGRAGARAAQEVMACTR